MQMRHSEYVDAAISFGRWGRRATAFSKHDKRQLLPMLMSSAGAILPKKALSNHGEWMDLLCKDLENRLSFDWVVPNKPAAYKVAFEASRHLYDEERVSCRAQGFLDASKTLGIAITVLDERGIGWKTRSTRIYATTSLLSTLPFPKGFLKE
jgi:hypothetical protein